MAATTTILANSRVRELVWIENQQGVIMFKKKISKLASLQGIMNPTQLSKESGIPRRTCYDLYTSSHTPSSKTLYRLKLFFQYSLDELLEDD
ncbi:hypothetical protein [Calothrix sp. NIES-2100]|uniref:hypothetical protein n=1 Tax=Calothrix sp. NIES-2100 TaxID=1954172 RepID=UPI0030DAB6B2